MIEFKPSGKLLAELARAARCNASVFKDGDGLAAVMAIVESAMPAAPALAKEAETAKPDPKSHHPATCWRCGSSTWERHQPQETHYLSRCTTCGTKCITPRFR